MCPLQNQGSPRRGVPTFSTRPPRGFLLLSRRYEQPKTTLPFLRRPHRLLAARRQKLDALRATGVDPFGARFDTDGTVGQIRERFAEGAVFRVAGRVTAHRDMGKSHFLDLSDLTGRIQFYVNLKNLTPEQAAVFALLDLGDFLGVEGEGFITKTGEPTIAREPVRAAFQGAPAAARQVPRAGRCRGAAPAALPRPARQREVARDVSAALARCMRGIRDVFPRTRLSGSRDAHDAAGRGRRGGGAVQDAPQRAGHRPVPAHRAGALSQAAAGRRISEGVRAQPQLPQRGAFAPAQPGVHDAGSVLGVRGHGVDGGPDGRPDLPAGGQRRDARTAATPRATSRARSTSRGPGGGRVTGI